MCFSVLVPFEFWICCHFHPRTRKIHISWNQTSHIVALSLSSKKRKKKSTTITSPWWWLSIVLHVTIVFLLSCFISMLVTLKIIFRRFFQLVRVLFPLHAKVSNNNDNPFEWQRNKTTFFYVLSTKGATAAGSTGGIEMCHRKRKNSFFLFTSLLFAFSLPTSVDKEIPQVKLKQTFPLLFADDIDGRAQWSVKNQLAPKLLNSYQGHLQSITGLIFSEQNEVLITSSCDKTVRLWSLSGKVTIWCSKINYCSQSWNEKWFSTIN